MLKQLGMNPETLHCFVTSVDYYAHTAMPKPNSQQEKRVLNGFALLTLRQDSIREEFYEVSEDGSQVAWQQTIPRDG